MPPKDNIYRLNCSLTATPSTVIDMRSWQVPQLPDISISLPPLRLFDTARKVVAPLSGSQQVSMYVCGITPYDATHIGHAATYITFDIINRFLRMHNKDVLYVQNVTDIDDPLLERAARDNIDWQDLARTETDLFRSDMEQLSVIPPTIYQGAVESIPGIIEAIELLLANNTAYVITHDQYPDIYYRVDCAQNFGSISGYSESMMAEIFPQRGGDPQRPGKQNPYDALLWRAARPGEPAWDSPFGPGRPGWHIECSVIALQHCTAPIDIQGGGSDLIYPHHEFSAAHCTSLTPLQFFARHHVHTGMMGFQGAKMSKSLGNLVLVSTLIPAGVDPSVIRLAVLNDHYWQDRMWDDELVKTAMRRWDLWRAAVAQPRCLNAETLLTTVGTHLSDNLDTPAALRAIDSWAEDTLQGLGNDTTAGRIVQDAIAYLLGVKL